MQPITGFVKPVIDFLVAFLCITSQQTNNTHKDKKETL